MKIKNSFLYCLDIGNTMTELAVINNQNINYKKHISTQSIKDAPKTLKLLFKAMHIEDINNFTSDIIISSVVPEVNYNVEALLKELGFNKVLFLKDLKLPLECNFEKTGADIIAKSFYLNLVGQTQALILDVGTATVMQYVKNNSIKSVAITIGLGTIYSALHSKTSLLPLITAQRIENILQTSTVPSVKAGTYWGYIGLLNMFVKKAQNELCLKDIKVFLTGGLSKLLVKDLEFNFIHDPDIIFKSLEYIYTLSMKGSNKTI